MPAEKAHMKVRLLLIWLFFPVLIGGLFSPLAIKAQSVDDALTGLNTTANKIDAFKEQTTSNDYNSGFLASEMGRLIGLALSFIGILFLGLMIYAGIRWMTAGGNEQAISQSKELLINATIGIVIVFAAYAITAFIGNQLIK